jgi:hypothetical protein
MMLLPMEMRLDNGSRHAVYRPFAEHLIISTGHPPRHLNNQGRARKVVTRNFSRDLTKVVTSGLRPVLTTGARQTRREQTRRLRVRIVYKALFTVPGSETSFTKRATSPAFAL